MAKKTKALSLSIEEKLEQALLPKCDGPYKIPENWCWVTLDSLGFFGMGQTILSKQLLNYGIPVYSATEEDKIFGYIPSCDNTIKLSTNDIVIPARGTIGYVKLIAEKEATCTQTTMFFKPIDKQTGRYIYYYMKSRKEELFAYHGNAIPQITINKVSKKEIALAPLPEQHRIVESIESLFSKLDKAKEIAQEVIDSFEIRKASILHKAFSGELTAKWREENGVGIDSWKKCSLINVLIDKPRNGYSPKPVDYPTNVKSMTLSATTSGVFMPQYYKYIDEHIPDNSYLWLKKGDILVQRANSIDKVGTSAIYTGENNEFIYPDLMMKLQVVSDVSSHYIAYQLKTQNVIQYFRNNATGTTGNMPKINQKVVSTTPIVTPSYDEQNEIVRILDNIFDKETKEKEAAEVVIEQIDTMKKAILVRAFCGELGTNDPSEESAIELLKRILSGE